MTRVDDQSQASSSHTKATGTTYVFVPPGFASIPLAALGLSMFRRDEAEHLQRNHLCVSAGAKVTREAQRHWEIETKAHAKVQQSQQRDVEPF